MRPHRDDWHVLMTLQLTDLLHTSQFPLPLCSALLLIRVELILTR